MNQALIDLGKSFIQAGGSPARAMLKANMDPGVLRTNDVLRKQEWQQLDEILVGVARQRLIGINDLRNRGLVVNLNGLGTTISQYEQLGDMSSADVDFSGVTDGEKDQVTFTLVSVPVPIIHKDFQIDIRRLAASRGANAIGAPIDTTQIETAAWKVTEQAEEILFNGFTAGKLQVGAGSTTQATLQGYTTATGINSRAGSSWATPANITPDVTASIDLVEAAKYFGPWVLYTATAQFGKLRAFLTDGSGDQIWDRIKRIQGLEDVRPGDRLAAGSAVLVTMRRDVIDVAIGQDLTVVEWETKGGMMSNFKVMCALSPRPKSDSAGGSGITKITGLT